MVNLIVPVQLPSVVYLEGNPKELEILEKSLTYRDRSAEFQYRKFRNARWFLNRYGEEAFTTRLNQLKDSIQKCCLLPHRENFRVTYVGLLGRIFETLKLHSIEWRLKNQVRYPEGQSLPWVKTPPPLRYYQKEAVDKLIESRHGAIEIVTGGGKSLIILELVRRLGLKTVIMAPSKSIADNLYNLFVRHLGLKYVGFVGDGKKKTDKLITIGIHASLTKFQPGDKGWEDLSSAQVFIVDESHLTPASTLEKVCVGLGDGAVALCGAAPYRFFLSATQMRSDGSGIVLQGITGPTVHSLDFARGVQEGFLSKPHFRILKVGSNNSFVSKDANEMTRAHLYFNPEVAKKVGAIVNSSVKRMGHQVLVLVQEVEQFSLLLPYLKVDVKFAHGGLTKDNKKKVPELYHDSDVIKIVEQFNNREFPVLVGTSCVSTGTDMPSINTLVYWQGQSSQVKVLQAVGRATRRTPEKNEFWCFDFDVTTQLDQSGSGESSTTHRHATIREGFYRELTDDVEVL